MKGRVLLVMAVVVTVVTGAALHDSDCHFPCPYNYDPVCGSDGKTYPNMCQLEGEKKCHNPDLTLDHKGECEAAALLNPDCPVICTKEYKPVCGSDGKTYANMCELEGEKCHNPDLTLAHKGECGKECSYGCSAIWDPVCGSDGKTYPNMCELKVTNMCYDPELTLDHKGECEAADSDCDFACPANYDPVCGSDGKTYGNMCELEGEKKCRNPDLTLAHKGECNSDCNFACPDNYDPVCGSDGKTYPNMCMLEGEKKCHNPDLTLAHKGECSKDCPYGCPDLWDPVCGSDGKTYANMCELNVTKTCYDPDLTLDHKGECEAAALPDPDCPVVCNKNYDPVCGSDGKTYGNMCELEGEKKCHNPDLTLAHKGECNADCPRPCFDIWDPVCGTDGNTYPNQCELEEERDCNGKPHLAVDHKGECTSTRGR